MTFVTIPNRPLGSDTRSIEMILADFDAITAVINGQLDQVNFSTGGASGLYLPGDLIISGASSRAGCLLCDGSAVSRTLYAALFAAIGGAYGVGDGSSTFNLPDLRGRVMMGAGAGPGLTARSLGQQPGIEAHNHNIPQLSLTGNTTSHSHPLSNNGGASVMGADVGGDDMVYWNATYTSALATMTRRIRWPNAQGGGTTHLFETVSSNVATPGLVGNTDGVGPLSVTGITGTGGVTDAQTIVQPSTVVNVFIKT